MCVVCVYSNVRAPPSTINTRTHTTIVSFVPPKSTAHWHPLLLFFSANTHIHTHPSLHLPMAILYCVEVKLLVAETALSKGLVTQQERHSTNYSTS